MVCPYWLFGADADESVSKLTIGVSATPFAETRGLINVNYLIHCRIKAAGNGVPAAPKLMF
jgi:hypothetical protein